MVWSPLVDPAVEAAASGVKTDLINPEKPGSSLNESSEEPLENLSVLLHVLSEEVDARLASLHVAVL